MQMNWNTVKGKWMQVTGSAKTYCGKLTGNKLQQADGYRDRLIGEVRERYGLARDAAEKRIDD
jgi:uncharacterized protein YjbJ (UPF0337 family)